MRSPDVSTAARSARAVLSWSRGMVEGALRDAVDELHDPIRHVAGYHMGWWDEQGVAVGAAAGKTIRPALTMLTAEGMGGSADSAVPAAAAVELSHNFSLLHDDVMDGDEMRRHRPTAWSIFGINAAILTGDALLALAFKVLAASGHPAASRATQLLASTMTDLSYGEQIDLLFESRHDVTVTECLTMVEKKTSILLGTSCSLGALFACAESSRVNAAHQFGCTVGTAFQHIDDVLGIWGDPSVTGKPVHADLRSRKKSLPVVAALSSGTAAGREFAELYHSDQPMTEADLSRAADLIDEAGGRSWSQAEADRLFAEALSHLASADLREPVASELVALARLATRREC